MSKLSKTIDSISDLQKKLDIKKNVLLDKALRSDDPTDIMKAQSVVQQIETREHSDKKSFLIDPNDFTTHLGYRHNKTGMSYELLKRMASTPVINAIIKTRINQIASFAEPQKDKYSTGFIITKKNTHDSEKLDKRDQKTANEITDIILNCGTSGSWSNDDFDTFTRKVLKDSLIYDQMNFEVVNTRRGDLHEFIAVDASTIRISDTYDDDDYKKYRKDNVKEIRGYSPSYVQIYQQNVTAEYYPWELCFGIRNPDSGINKYGYGTSELEELIHVITAILWSDEYNRRFFSQGSAPKGILRVDSSVNPAKLQEFKQQWQAMVSGVYNAWKTPVLEAGKMDFVNLQTNNKDMEYSQWMEYLVKLACSIYCINPEEINFPSTSSGASTVFESNNESKLKHSKDKGLYPLLKFYQARLNKHVIQRINPEYELRFVGIDAVTKEQEMELMIKKVTNLITLDEAREELGYDKLNIEGVSDQVQSGIYSQFKMQSQMGGGGEEQLDGQVGEGQGEEEQLNEQINPFGNEQ